MKRVLLIILSLSLSSSTLLAQDFWEVLPVPEDFHGRSSATNSLGWLFIGTNDGVYRSTENGHNLEKIGLQNTIIDLEIDKNNHILAGSGILYYSDDNGVTWQEIATPEFINETYFKDSLIIFGNAGEIYKSSDFGNSWFQTLLLNSTQVVNSIVDGHNGFLYAGITAFFGGGGVYRSDNNGDTWEYAGLINEWVQQLSIDTKGTIYAASYSGMYDAGGGIFKSSDLGITWLQLSGMMVSTIVIDTNNIIYVGCTSDSWPGGCYRSCNNGQTWELYNTGMGQYPSVKGMCLSPDGYLYAYDSKLYRTVKPVYTATKPKEVKKGHLNISPNPVPDYLTIQTTLKDYTIQIADVTGRVVYNKNKSTEKNLNVASLTPGIYVLTIIDDNYSASQKFVKQ